MKVNGKDYPIYYGKEEMIEITKQYIFIIRLLSPIIFL